MSLFTNQKEIDRAIKAAVDNFKKFNKKSKKKKKEKFNWFKGLGNKENR